VGAFEGDFVVESLLFGCGLRVLCVCGCFVLCDGVFEGGVLLGCVGGMGCGRGCATERAAGGTWGDTAMGGVGSHVCGVS